MASPDEGVGSISVVAGFPRTSSVRILPDTKKVVKSPIAEICPLSKPKTHCSDFATYRMSLEALSIDATITKEFVRWAGW
jgi:hypothetical protein